MCSLSYGLVVYHNRGTHSNLFQMYIFRKKCKFCQHNIQNSSCRLIWSNKKLNRLLKNYVNYCQFAIYCRLKGGLGEIPNVGVALAMGLAIAVVSAIAIVAAIIAHYRSRAPSLNHSAEKTGLKKLPQER